MQASPQDAPTRLDFSHSATGAASETQRDWYGNSADNLVTPPKMGAIPIGTIVPTWVQTRRYRVTATLKVIAPTTFKRRPLQSVDLPDGDRFQIGPPASYEISAYTQERGHIKFTLRSRDIQGFNTWYAFSSHVELLDDEKPKVKDLVKLAVPFKCQLDNDRNPTGSCNVTSLAMCMEYLGVTRKTTEGQFEDELYRYAERRGLSRHDPNDLEKISKEYGIPDDFRVNATIEDVKEWLSSGKPCITHGYFTSFGHIVAIVGYDEKGFICHDPYGEWSAGGYSLNAGNRQPGRYVRYSYNLIRRLCIPDGNFWVHFMG
jgi:uncharacterized protein YvpB